MAAVDGGRDMAEFEARPLRVAVAMDDPDEPRREILALLLRQLEGDGLSRGDGIADGIAQDLQHGSVAEGQVDILAGMGPPAPAEDLPLRFLAAGEDRPLLDLERAVATGRHQPEHPGG